MKKLTFILAVSYQLLAVSFTAKAQYTDLFNFGGTKGSAPYGSLTFAGNKFYGKALWGSGGFYTSGCVFSVDTNGSNYKILVNFNGTNGAAPYGNLTLVGNKLYGTTSAGGAHGDGCIFSIDTNSTSSYQDMFDFNGSDGANPHGSLTLLGNKLVGMAANGGANSDGCIFSIDTNSGSSYKDLFDFNGSDGANPQGSLLILGNKLFGMTAVGGVYDSGCIFSIDTNGSAYKKLVDLNTSTGSIPLGDLAFSGSSYKLFGMTSRGGANPYYGCIFSLDTSGNGYKDIFDFNGSNGDGRVCSLTINGNMLYGTTPIGGPYYGGTIFSIGVNGVGYRDILNFHASTTIGWQPSGSLVLLGYKLYGMTDSSVIAGHDGGGIIFSFETITCANNYNEPICIVTIDTATNKSKVIWGRTNSPPAGGYGYYNVYKNSGAASLIHSQPLDSLSEFIDTSSNPSAGVQSYQLSTSDSCGESALSASCSSIFLTTTQGTHAYIMNWTPYVGFTPVRYRIFRGPSMSRLTQIDSVPNNVFTYIDSFPPINVFYVLEAVSPSGVCTPTTHGPNGHNLNISLLSGSFSNGFNTALLGVQNAANTNTNLKVYPNPTTGIVNGKLSRANENTRLEVYNVLGEQIQQVTINNTQFTIDLSTQPNGVYFYRVIAQDGSLVGDGKLVIQK